MEHRRFETTCYDGVIMTNFPPSPLSLQSKRSYRFVHSKESKVRKGSNLQKTIKDKSLLLWVNFLTKEYLKVSANKFTLNLCGKYLCQKAHGLSLSQI